MSRRRLPWLAVATSAGLLLGLAFVLDFGEIAARLLQLDLGWAALALAVTVPQVAVSAWRWRFTAGRLGAPLGYPRALREYYLATFLNQILPAGVLGDAARAWRHGSSNGSFGAPVHAVVLERASGQMALAVVVLGVLLLTPALAEPLAASVIAGDFSLLAVTALAAIPLAVPLSLHYPALRTAGGHLLADCRRALLTPTAFAVQLLTSLVVVATYLGVFLPAARAVGIATAFAELLPPTCLALLPMASPPGVAGWGLRDTAAAFAWPLAGLGATDGVAIAVTYGVLVLLSSLPGAVVLLAVRSKSKSTSSPSAKCRHGGRSA